MNRILMPVATHGVALCLGWSLWVNGGVSRLDGSSPLPPNTRIRSRDPDDTATTVQKADVEELLASLRKSEGVSGRDWRLEQTERIQRAFARIDTFNTPANLKKAFEDLIAVVETRGSPFSDDELAEVFALTYHWFAKEPDSLFACLAPESKSRIFLTNTLGSLSPEIYRRQGIGNALAVLSKMNPEASFASRSLAEAVALKTDSSAVIAAKQTLLGEMWIGFALEAGRRWPVSDADNLVKIAVELDAPRLILGMVEAEPGQVARLARLLDDASLPQGFRDFLRNSDEMRIVLMRDSALPLDLRLQGWDAGWLVRNDVSQVFNQKRDWPFAFRRGEASAEEVLAAVAAETPELAARESALLRDHVFGELAEENPAAAMALLKDEPVDVRNQKALTVARTHFENVEPPRFLEMLQQIPSDTPEAWEGRLDAWNLRSFTNNGRLHEAYVEWVENLPAGLDRDMALYSLARAVTDTKLAARLRSQVKDPQLQHRIATHQ